MNVVIHQKLQILTVTLCTHCLQRASDVEQVELVIQSGL